MITIAIPSAEGRLHGHFGGCREFTLVEADLEQKKILGIRTAVPPPHAPGLFPRWLREQGVSVVIAGGIGRRALALFEREGIEVRAGLPDAPVEELATAYLNGRLTATPEGCEHHGHHHDPEHGHEHHHPGHSHHCHEQGDEPTR
jgi:predicted Fe-Mo cluster-binding NifX family protein